MSSAHPSVALLTLGCGRNEVDSAQVGGRLAQAGFALVDEPSAADCVLVNTCTFIEPARRESVEAILEACEPAAPGAAAPKVLVIGCMAERYGAELAEALPEVEAVVGFAGYARLPELVGDALGVHPRPRPPRSLPLLPGPADGPGAPHAPPTVGFPVRTAPQGPWAYLKLAGGCDRRCTFCTIPSYRGWFASRPVGELSAEAAWLVANGARELVGVSENTTSYGKDLPGGRAAQRELIAAFESVEGLERVRLLYLQPDELEPGLLEAMAASPVVAGYYDLSLQHASASVLRRMARGGDAETFLALIEAIRARDPDAVFRSSFIVGFPGERERDVAELEDFLVAAQLDWVGFFCYSPEEGTASAVMPEQVDPDEARRRRDHLATVQELVAAERAEAFIGRRVRVLIEAVEGGEAFGRSHREAPETDAEVRVLDAHGLRPGDLIDAEIAAADGVDLLARRSRETLAHAG